MIMGYKSNNDNKIFFFFSSRRRHTRFSRDWSSDVCSSDLFWSWEVSYLVMAALVGVGAVTVLLVREPKVNHFAAAQDIAHRIEEEAAKRGHLPPRLARLVGWFYAAIAGPFLDFFRRYKELARSEEHTS